MTFSNISTAQVLIQTPLFSSLSAPEIEELASLTSKKNILKYTFVYAEGEQAKNLFMLLSGSIKISTHAELGREVIKTVVQPGGVFGEGCLAGEKNREDAASSLKVESSFLIFPMEKIEQLMRVNFRFCRAIIEHIGERLRTAERQLESLVIKDARTRIVEFLKDNAVLNGRKVGFETLVKHPFTHQDIAAITGTSRQMVTAVMNELKRSNLIYFNRHSFLVRDVAKLA